MIFKSSLKCPKLTNFQTKNEKIFGLISGPATPKARLLNVKTALKNALNKFIKVGFLEVEREFL